MQLVFGIIHHLIQFGEILRLRVQVDVLPLSFFLARLPRRIPLRLDRGLQVTCETARAEWQQQQPQAVWSGRWGGRKRVRTRTAVKLKLAMSAPVKWLSQGRTNAASDGSAARREKALSNATVPPQPPAPQCASQSFLACEGRRESRRRAEEAW